jgi:hypothetical protein
MEVDDIDWFICMEADQFFQGRLAVGAREFKGYLDPWDLDDADSFKNRGVSSGFPSYDRDPVPHGREFG